MRTRTPLAPVLLLAAFAGVAALACSTPGGKSKKPKRTVLMTSYDDAKVGKEASAQVAAQVGLLGDEALDAYVTRIGKKLLRGIPRRRFNFEFKVVNQVEANAFALPGGYIYISRGLLALANNEDELANVIGHEIIHAARRHSAAQQAVGGNQFMQALRWRDTAAYGRDLERTADREGQLLAAAAGYDPAALATFMRQLNRQEREILGGSRRETWFDSHPGTRERAGTAAARARELRWTRDPAIGDPRAAYLTAITGLPVGERPADGVFRGPVFLHPDLDFQLRFPTGWDTANTNSAVGASSRRGDAVVFFSPSEVEGKPRQAAETFAAKASEEQGMNLNDADPVKVGRLDAWRIELEGGGAQAMVTFFEYGPATWTITGASHVSIGDKYRGRTLATMRSFRPLEDEERSSFFETRLRVVTAQYGEDVDALTARTQNVWSDPETMLYNALQPGHTFEGGELVKVVEQQPYAVPSRE